MEEWLDSLSEDWPSRPPSQQSEFVVHDSSPPLGTSQSRLPRSKSSTLSRSSLAGRRPSTNLSRPSISQIQEALKERSSSSINASRKRVSSGREKNVGVSALSRTIHGEEGSENAVGTVQYRHLDGDPKDLHGTPEWRRRILQGQVGLDGQTDLFAPIGLENVFRPPVTAPKSKNEAIDGSRMPMEYTKHEELLNEANLQTNGTLDAETESASRLEHQHIERRASSQANHSEDGRKQLETDETFVSEDSPLPESSKSVKDAKVEARSGLENEGQTYLGSEQCQNEDISPFYVSKHHTMDGRVDFAAIDMSVHTLHRTIAKARRHSQRIPQSVSSDNVREGSYGEGLTRFMRENEIGEITSQSLPGDLSVGTDAFIANGGFVNLHRGGHSKDGSFQRRSLSPSSSLSQNRSTLASVSASREAVDRTPQSSPPRTPLRGGLQQRNSPERPKSSGSPLKLFDKHDTFTFNRLARRMSKFEETLRQELDEKDTDIAKFVPSSPSPGPKCNSEADRRNAIKPWQGRRASSFGDGELDGHQFSSMENSGYILPEQTVENATDSFQRSRTKSKEKGSGRKLSSSLRSYSLTTGDVVLSASDKVHRMDDQDYSLKGRSVSKILFSEHGKQLPNSPIKSQTSKRRKTLSSENEPADFQHDGNKKLPNSALNKSPEKSFKGRKRKDARYDKKNQIADPNVIASRPIRRHRNSTLNRSQSSDIPPSPLQSTEVRANGESSPVISHSTLKVDPPTQIVAGALATVALNTAQDITDGSRKVSIMTSDFFQEAQQIMALIRADTRPRSSHKTVYASKSASPPSLENVVDADSTKDSFSRPPSRQGRVSRTTQDSVSYDARVISHLRKFEDHDELGLAVPSVVGSLKIVNGQTMSSEDQHREGSADHCDTQININEKGLHRTTNDSIENDKCTLQDPQNGHELRLELKETNSVDSSKQSCTIEMRTGSSHSSVAIQKIAPESVAHLLSDKMADMVFDRVRKVWVRCKRAGDIEDADQGEDDGSDTAQEDLFGDIPDLSVDEMDELRRVKDAVGLGTNPVVQEENISYEDYAILGSLDKADGFPVTTTESRPKTADGKLIQATEESSAPSKYSNFAWSGPLPGTRATSYGDAGWENKNVHEATELPPVIQSSQTALSEEDSEAEHEFTMLEGRNSPTPAAQGSRKHQARVVTVAFSSPLVQSPDATDNNVKENSNGNDSKASRSRPEMLIMRSSRYVPKISARKSTSRRASMMNCSLIARPMSRLDEQCELSLVQFSRGHDGSMMDLAISTPLPVSRSLMLSPIARNNAGTCLELTPLPDFTMHQVDKPIEIEGEHPATEIRAGGSRLVSRALSLTAQTLVKHLTDTEPFEPYWEFLKCIDLRSRGLNSLHMLEEFCSRTEQLDVSENNIGELGGIPSTVRILNISRNCLSDLTGWHRSLHLQYLDLSSNALHSLAGLGCLIHLRTLKANDNRIKNLDGIRNLDGLLHLSVVGNSLKVVDFKDFNL